MTMMNCTVQTTYWQEHSELVEQEYQSNREKLQKIRLLLVCESYVELIFILIHHSFFILFNWLKDFNAEVWLG